MTSISADIDEFTCYPLPYMPKHWTLEKILKSPIFVQLYGFIHD